jgi:hypothetical protein
MGTTTIERYRVTKTHHCGPLERELRQDSTIDITPDYVAVDGQRMNGHRAAVAAELVRVMAQRGKFIEKVGEVEAATPDDAEQEAAVKTQTLAIWPILGCLKAADEFIGGIDRWTQVNEDQTEFFEQFADHINDVDLLGDYLRRKANSDYKVINKWLRDNGFDIELTQNPGPGGFAVASILDVLVEWLKKGSRRKVDTLKGSFDAVKLKEGVSIRQHPDVSKHPVVRIATQSGVRVCMAIVDDIPEGRYGLLSRIRSLSVVEAMDYRFEGVIFPMVKYDRHEDISYFCGLKCDKEGTPGWFVSEAVQQTRFRMNEVGARAESAVAMGFRCCAAAPSKKPYVIDRPFVLWMEHDELPMPLFAGLFAEDVWEDPKNLDDVKVD